LGDALQRQWGYFASLSGKWQGTWHRFSADELGALKSRQTFPGICHPKLSNDERSLHVVNQYPVGMLPPGMPEGEVVDGMHRVDFGVFDATNFQSPLGPQTRAIYFDGAGVVGSSKLTPTRGRIGVEFMIASGDGDPEPKQRRRLVALWQMTVTPGELKTVRLTSVTAIVERRQPAQLSQWPEKELRVADASWHGERMVVTPDGSESQEKAPSPASPSHELPGGIVAWLPADLPDEPGDLELAMGWQRPDGWIQRVAAVYRGGMMTSATHDDLRPKL